MQSDAVQIPHYNTVNPFILIKGGADQFIDFVVFVFDGVENRSNRTPDRDGSLIHAEIQVGNAMLLIADSKEDWPFTPAFLQVYVQDAAMTLQKAVACDAKVITEVSPFYHGLKLARIQDSWGNLWWIYEKSDSGEPPVNNSNVEWHQREPGYVYTTLMHAMKQLTRFTRLQ